jgi:hypothetical protein
VGQRLSVRLEMDTTAGTREVLLNGTVISTPSGVTLTPPQRSPLFMYSLMRSRPKKAKRQAHRSWASWKVEGRRREEMAERSASVKATLGWLTLVSP